MPIQITCSFLGARKEMVRSILVTNMHYYLTRVYIPIERDILISFCFTMSGKETVKSGYLTKSPPDNKSSFYVWKKRYFILIDSHLAFPFAPRHIRIEYYPSYEDSKLGNPLGMIELNKCSGVLKREQMKSHKHVFDIVTPSRVFHLSAESMEEREEWVELLNKNIFLFNQINPVQNISLKYDPNRRSSDFSQESEISMIVSSNKSVKSEPRTQSLRIPKSKSVFPSSPPPNHDMFFPTSPDGIVAPNSYSKNLKIISSVKDSDPMFDIDYSENEIVSEQGFTAIPLPEQQVNRHSMIASLPVTNESPYINVAFTSGIRSGDSSPTHPMLPAPYRKVPISNSMQVVAPQKFSDDAIESEYTCIDPLKMAPILEEYAQVKKHK